MSYTKTTWANGDTITAEKLNNAESGIEEINMSYEKQTWSNGDTITAEKLNYMENGISGGGGGGAGTLITITMNCVGEPGQKYAYSLSGEWGEDDEYHINGLFDTPAGYRYFGDGVILAGESKTINAIYLGNPVLLGGNNPETTQVSGNIEPFYEDGELTGYNIKGDCSITVTGITPPPILGF